MLATKLKELRAKNKLTQAEMLMLSADLFRNQTVQLATTLSETVRLYALSLNAPSDYAFHFGSMLKMRLFRPTLRVLYLGVRVGN